MGVFSPAGRQVFQLGAPREVGTVSVVCQSGGLAGDIVMGGHARGVRFANLATVGNSIDVTPAELVAWLIDDPGTAVIGLYLEGTPDGRRLVDVLRSAAGRKPVVVLAGGLSRQGARAVASHTGVLAGDARVWEAIEVATGATRVDTLEELLAVLAYLQRWAAAEVDDDHSVLVVGPGGGASVLATDACDRVGLDVAPVGGETEVELRALGYGAGTSVVNPLEIPVGPATGPDAFDRAVEVVLARRPFPDLLLHVNVQAYYGYGPGDVGALVALVERVAAADWPGCRVAFVARNLDCAPGADADALTRAAAGVGLPLFRTLNEATIAIAAAKRFTRLAR